MELTLKLHHRNCFPLAGILIKGNIVKNWLVEIQTMGLILEKITVYPIPGTTANSVWGCLVICGVDGLDIGKNSYCQLVNRQLFIPEKSILFPAVSDSELKKLLGLNQHLFHPDFGLVELTETLDWANALLLPAPKTIEISTPKEGVFIPSQIKSFQVIPLATEDILENMEERVFPKKQDLEDKPLNPLEKVKLGLYEKLFRKDKEVGSTEKTPLMEFLSKLLGKSEMGNRIQKDIEEDFEDLAKRNQSQLEKLLELLKNNPEEALKYAIPLDNDRTNRGGNQGQFNLSKRWFDFSLSGNSSGGGGNAVLPDDGFQQLHRQYNQTAEDLIKKKEYHKAAFVYMKLLKNHYLAAQTLENGLLYQDAAAVYLKHLENKQKAAECYEKGNMTQKAIDLYLELNQDEKLGDLYMGINQQKNAFKHYEKVVDGYKQNSQYLKASLIYRNKMQSPDLGQNILLEGWQTNRDAFNCLNNYFTNIEEPKILNKAIRQVYENDVKGSNQEMFLKVIKHEFDKHESIREPIKDIAHEIIVAQVTKNPYIISELKSFEKNDRQLQKDILRFKTKK